jgi:hypothetical protein
MKISNINIQTLLIFWCIGAATAAIALLIPVYTIFLLVGSIGWTSVGLISFIIIYSLKNN